jgi:hypothetical protein
MWKDICLNAPDGVPVTLDIAEWLGRAALDMWVSISYIALFSMADVSVGSGRVRVFQGHETGAGCDDSTLAVFEYEFGALDRLDNPITTTYLNLVYATLLRFPPANSQQDHRNAAFGTKPPPVNLFVSDVAQYFPPGILSWLFERDQTPGPVKLRENRKQVHAVARTLIDAKREDMRNGDQGKDVLSLLSKSWPEVRG